MSETLTSGKIGEQLTADYLTRRGFTIIARNYHSRYGEIDLIARDDTFLLFVEVKARKYSLYAAPREAVTPSKQRKIRNTALMYLEDNPTELQPRFDVAEVYLYRDGRGRVEYYDNAFE